MMKNISIQYLYNSGFRIELEHTILIFDYYPERELLRSKGMIEEHSCHRESDLENYGEAGSGIDSKADTENGIILETELITSKAVYVFVSHQHYDHYSPEIFGWRNVNRNIYYVLSSDVPTGELCGNITKMNAYDSVDIGEVCIRTFGSTDEGVSFYIKAEGLAFFHAGDLNWWHWWDCNQKENQEMENRFLAEMDHLKDIEGLVDVAFFPVDSRLKEAYRKGVDYFTKAIYPRYLIPMHFREDIDSIIQYQQQSSDVAGYPYGLSCTIMPFTDRGQRKRIHFNK